MSILSQIIAYSPNKIDTETKVRSLVQGPRNMANGGRIGFAKRGFVSGSGTGVKGIDDPKKYKIVKKYLNKVKSQKNKRIFLDWFEQIDGKKTKWYTDLSKEVQLSRDPLNKLINKVTLEEFPTAYAGKSGRVNHAREMVVKSFIDYWNQNGAFDGNEKLSNVLKQFQKDSVDKRFENINRYFMDWKEGKFEVPGVDRKNLDKNLLKDIKNYKPNAKDVRSLTVAKQLKYLDGLSPKYSFDTVEKLFAKQFPDNAQTLQHRLNQLTQLKRNGAYNTGAGNVQKIATIKIGDRPKWLIEGYGKGFKGNYGNLIKKADDLLAAGDKVNAERLYKAADKFFSPNGIFTKAAGEGEHPLSRNMGDGPIGNQLKINSLVSGDLNQFKKFNFDSPVRNAVLEYNNPKTTDARRTNLKIEIENRKKLMNILTEGPNQKGIVESVKFNYGPKELTASVDVKDIDKIKNFDINKYITAGEDYRKSFVAKGENLGLIDKSGNIIKQKIDNNQLQQDLLKLAGTVNPKCRKSAVDGGRIGFQDGLSADFCINEGKKVARDLVTKNITGSPAQKSIMKRITSGVTNFAKSILDPKELFNLKKQFLSKGALASVPIFDAVMAADDALRKDMDPKEAFAKTLTFGTLPRALGFTDSIDVINAKKMLENPNLSPAGKEYAQLIIDSGDYKKMQSDTTGGMTKKFTEFKKMQEKIKNASTAGRFDYEKLLTEKAATDKAGEYVGEPQKVGPGTYLAFDGEEVRKVNEFGYARKGTTFDAPDKPDVTPLINKLATPAKSRGPMTEKKKQKVDYTPLTYQNYKPFSFTKEEFEDTMRQIGSLKEGQVYDDTFYKEQIETPMRASQFKEYMELPSFRGSQFSKGGIASLNVKK